MTAVMEMFILVSALVVIIFALAFIMHQLHGIYQCVERIELDVQIMRAQFRSETLRQYDEGLKPHVRTVAKNAVDKGLKTSRDWLKNVMERNRAKMAELMEDDGDVSSLGDSGVQPVLDPTMVTPCIPIPPIPPVEPIKLLAPVKLKSTHVTVRYRCACSRHLIQVFPLEDMKDHSTMLCDVCGCMAPQIAREFN